MEARPQGWMRPSSASCYQRHDNPRYTCSKKRNKKKKNRRAILREQNGSHETCVRRVSPDGERRFYGVRKPRIRFVWIETVSGGGDRLIRVWYDGTGITVITSVPR